MTLHDIALNAVNIPCFRAMWSDEYSNLKLNALHSNILFHIFIAVETSLAVRVKIVESFHVIDSQILPVLVRFNDKKGKWSYFRFLNFVISAKSISAAVFCNPALKVSQNVFLTPLF